MCEPSFSDLILVRLMTPIVKAPTSELGASGLGNLCCVLANCHLGNCILFTFDIFFDFKSGSNSTSFLVVKWCHWLLWSILEEGCLLSSREGREAMPVHNP